MSLILNIDTATSFASVCLAENGRSLGIISNHEQMQHASFLQPAIDELLKITGKKISDLEAIAVTIGPGSYTGLRVGLASAKGICYAMKIPLITESTLKVMAAAVNTTEAELLCPMIDARRMEVFTAVYDRSLQPVVGEQAMILSENSFIELLQQKKVCFTGDGAPKWKNIIQIPNAVFENIQHTAEDLARLSFAGFEEKRFADLAYTAPVYLKEFYSRPLQI